MPRIRFSGVVRLANRVQQELSGPLPSSRREELRRQVHQTIELVDRTVRLHGASLRAVPGPTRRALELLRSIDFDQAQVTGEGQAGPPRESVTLKGLVAQVEMIADCLAGQTVQPLGDATTDCEDVRRLLDRIDASNERTGLRPQQLTRRTREHLAWLRFVADPENLAGYLDAVHRACEAFGRLAPPDRWPRPHVVHFRPTQSLFRLRAEPAQTRVLLPTPMIVLDDEGFTLLGRAMFSRRDRRRNATLHAMLLSEPYQNLRAELEALAGVVEDVRGMAHDLAESFDRVNTAYFGGQMPRPRLTWNRTITAGKFGHYNYSCDTVMISRALDHSEVPAFVVDQVMHHELLHKKHGLRWQNGRGHAHTWEFRCEEQQFVQYQQADQFLRMLATRKR